MMENQIYIYCLTMEQLYKNNIINVLSKQNYQGPVVFEINPYKYSLKDILEHPSVKNLIFN